MDHISSLGIHRMQVRPGPAGGPPFTLNYVTGGAGSVRDLFRAHAQSLEVLVASFKLLRENLSKRSIKLGVEILVPGLTPAMLNLADDEVLH